MSSFVTRISNLWLALPVLSFSWVQSVVFSSTLSILNQNMVYFMCAQFQCSHSVVSDSLQPHGMQHARLPFPSPAPGACSNSCPSSWWCHPTISSSVVPFSCLSHHQGLFQWVSSSHQVARVLEFQLQYQSFQWIFRTDFLYDWLVWTPCSPRDSPESSPTPQFKRHQFFKNSCALVLCKLLSLY